MTEAILMVVAVTAMCFMATCLVVVLRFGTEKRKNVQVEEDPEEIERLERIAEQNRQDIEAWQKMMSYNGDFIRKGGDGQ